MSIDVDDNISVMVDEVNIMNDKEIVVSVYATENGKYMIANVMTNHLKNIYPKNYNF